MTYLFLAYFVYYIKAKICFNSSGMRKKQILIKKKQTRKQKHEAHFNPGASCLFPFFKCAEIIEGFA